MRFRRQGIVVLALFVAHAAIVEGGQRSWPGVGKKQVLRPERVTSRVAPVFRPRAEISRQSSCRRSDKPPATLSRQRRSTTMIQAGIATLASSSSRLKPGRISCWSTT